MEIGDVKSASCRKCSNHQTETVQHVLFECPNTVEYRMLKWTDVKGVSLPNLINAIENMTALQKTTFVLNAFNCKYIQEWSVTYDAI